MSKKFLGFLLLLVISCLSIGAVWSNDFTKALASFSLALSILIFYYNIESPSQRAYLTNKLILDEFLIPLFYFKKYFRESSPNDEIYQSNIEEFRKLFNGIIFPMIDIHYRKNVAIDSEYNIDISKARALYYADSKLRQSLIDINEIINNKCSENENIDYSCLTKKYKNFISILDVELENARHVAALKNIE